MVTDSRSLIERRNDEVAALATRERERRPDQPLAAIELCAENKEEREKDLRAVRDALADGTPPTEIGPLFVTVVADLTYEIDWGDQFKFWPHLAKSIAVSAFDVANDHDRRRDTADAFDAFAERFGGVYPVGSFSSQFPLMSRPLVHSMLPRCAQRHVARLLARASSDGDIPNDGESPWPVDHLVELGESLSLPLFVRGLLENRAVLEPAGRALLGLTGSDPANWARRIADTVRADAVTQDLVDRARRSVRSTIERQRALVSPRVSVALTQPLAGDGPAMMWIELGPLAAAERAVEGLGAFARTGAVLRTVVNKKALDERPMIAALAGPLVLVYPTVEHPIAVSFTARAFVGAVPEAVSAYLARGVRDLKLPLILKARGAARFTEFEVNEPIETGTDMVIVLSEGAPMAQDLSALGFERIESSVAGLAMMRGVASESAASALALWGVAVRPPTIDVEPVLIPPSRRRRDELTYPPRAEAWLRVRGACSPGLRVEAEPSSGVTVFVTEDGEYIVRVRADEAVDLRFFYGAASRAAARANIRFESIDDGAQATRWRAALQPSDATTAHLVERLCWVRVESLPGVSVCFDLVATFGGTCRKASATARPEDVSTPLASMQFLNRLLDAAAVDPDDAPPEQITLTGWCEDEPERARVVARVGPSTAAVRFEPTEAGLSVASSAGAATLSRIEITTRGVLSTTCADAVAREPGLYVASLEGVHVAACVAERNRRLPRLASITPPPRSLDGLRESLALMRALDVAVIWPTDAFAHGLLVRRAAVRAVEQALIGTLCGEEWLQHEERLAAPGVDRIGGLARLKYLTWISEQSFDDAIAEAEDGEDPFAVVSVALTDVSLTTSELEAARHLMLLFYRRGLASSSGDERAMRFAWSNRQVARVIRLAYLAIPDAFDRRRASDDTGVADE